MAFTMKQSLVSAPVVQQVRAPRAAAAPLKVVAAAEETSRRAAMGAIFGAGLALIAGSAEAKVIVPSQFSYGGIGQATGKQGNTSTQSMEAYNMEGTKKKGISPKRKAKVLAQVKKEAAAATAAKPAAETKKK